MSDNLNNDDFDLENFDDGFNDVKGEKGSLGDIWRNNPLIKFGVILLGVALLVVVFSVFGGEEKEVTSSSMASGSDVSEAPGGEQEMSENIMLATEDKNTANMEKALRESGSFVPIPTNSTRGQIPVEIEQEEKEAPLDRWRRLQEEKVRQAQVQATAAPEQTAVDTRTPAIQTLSESMSKQMESILGNQELKNAQVKQITNIDYLENIQKKIDDKAEEERQKRDEEFGVADNSSSTQNPILLPAGTIEYAQLITEANTDVPGPILAEILTGPFKGARMVGSFDQTYNYLTLNFDKIILDGVDYKAKGVAIDPDTTLPGVVTDINRRYFTRVVLPVAAEFISGFSQAISDSGTTSITIEGSSVTQTTSNSDRSNDQEVALGVATAGKELSSIIQEIKDNNPQLLRVRAGTPIGVLFVDAVTENKEEEVSGPYQQLQNFQLLNSVPNLGQNPAPNQPTNTSTQQP